MAIHEVTRCWLLVCTRVISFIFITILAECSPKATFVMSDEPKEDLMADKTHEVSGNSSAAVDSKPQNNVSESGDIIAEPRPGEASNDAILSRRWRRQRVSYISSTLSEPLDDLHSSH